MIKQNTIRNSGTDHLSVIHKAADCDGNESFQFQDAVIQTNLQFNITGWNLSAEHFHGLAGSMNLNIFEQLNFEFINGSPEKLKADLKNLHCWSGELVFPGPDGQPVTFRSIVNYILNELEQPFAVLFVNHNISDIKNKERQLAAVEKEYETLVNTLFDGVVMIKADGKIGACNRRAAEILGLTEEELLGRVSAHPAWKAIKVDGSEFPIAEFPSRLCLNSGMAQRNVVMGVEQPDQTKVWLLVNSQALFHPGDKNAYAAVVSFTDITDKLKSEEALRKSNERFIYAGKVTSDAIWDIDLDTNEIYRSEAFNSFSGYPSEMVRPDLDWWFDKVHPEDRERVRNKVNESIQRGIAHWKDEYRFLCADGKYKYLLDSGIIMYKDKKPVRIIGAIQDLTERKQLEARLLLEEVQKQKELNKATIAAQEQERNNISKELHDNVNQILMSAKLFMSTAQKNPEQSEELLIKAGEYQLLALEEIRKLSKSLNTSWVKTVGLKESVTDITGNMKMLQNLNVNFSFNERVEEKLNNEQKLMIFRIIQEQTSNIIKHADARNVELLINETKGIIHLLISDDGRGFDRNQKGKGIGFVNIFNRVDAYNGKISIISSPGNGCTLELRFPVNATGNDLI